MKPNLRLQRKIMNVIRSTDNGSGGVWKFTEILASGNFTVPVNLVGTTIFVTGCGGGGSGQAHQNFQGGGFYLCGGSSGHFVESFPVTVTPGEVISVTIGAGGTAVATSNSAGAFGNPGGDTIFKSLVIRGGGVSYGYGPADGGFYPPYLSRSPVTSTGQVRDGDLIPGELTGRYRPGLLTGVSSNGIAYGGGGSAGYFGDGADGAASTSNSDLTASSALPNTGAGGGSAARIRLTADPDRVITSGAGGSGRLILAYQVKE